MSLKRILVQTLFNTSRLTSTLTQVVQFSFTYSTTTFNSNAVNYRRVSLKTRSTPSPLEILRTVNAECRPRLRIAITTPSNACRRFWNLQQPILSLPRCHRTEGRYVLLHLLLFKLLNNVAHNLISYPGKLIFGSVLRFPIMFMLLVRVFSFELGQQLCLLFSQSRFSRSSGLLSRVRPSDCFKRQRRISAWFPDSNTAGTSIPSNTSGRV